MALRITPEDNPHTNLSSEARDQNLYSAEPSNSESEFECVPEREFVLMPLFRRIGEMFGIRRCEQPEYIYVPETAAPRSEVVAEPEPELANPPVPVVVHMSEASARLASTPEDDILELEGEPVSETILDQPSVSEHELQPTIQQHVEAKAEPELLAPEPVLLQAADAQETEAEAVESLEISEPISTSAQVQLPPPVAVRPLTQRDANDLVAQIREAAIRISAVVAQAAVWLHSKEEDILRRAEMPLEPAKPIERKSQSTGQARADSEVARNAPAIAAPEWESSEVPALQRELAWQHELASSMPVEKSQPSEMNAPRAADTPRVAKRPRLVSKPMTVPFWKRIDWGQQFTPQRVAVLGAFAMAILLILGISFARRPAASELPQQTRDLRPGGVTLSTHPVTSPAAPPQTQQRTSEPRRSLHSQPHRAYAANDGSDVVTHYYRKPKPSPIPQSAAVGGVRHYSDTQ